MDELPIGTKMRKVRGYAFDGEVRGSVTTRSGELRYVCELEGQNGGGMLHIFSPAQIESRANPSPDGERS
jgi:hypothetical protein